jgi:hypothetical protein
VHPTVKPVSLVGDAIKDASKRDVVLDAFAGSGTTIAAAAKTGRRGFALELDPAYCDVTLRRLAAFVKAAPVHAASGKTYSIVAAERSAANDEQAKNIPKQGLMVEGKQYKVGYGRPPGRTRFKKASPVTLQAGRRDILVT